MFGWLTNRRRRALAREPLPAPWTTYLDAHVVQWRRLKGEDQERFLSLLKVFVGEKRFVGAADLEVTDEMKVVVAASAVRLVLHLGIEHYDNLTEIVLYPQRELVDGSDGQRFLGRAHHHGAIILSWPRVLEGLHRSRDGHDTATHEFAHALDLGDRVFDGAPLLRAREDYRPWAEVLGTHFAALQKRPSAVLRDYGATNPAEFFAVATEAFIERPSDLRKRAPTLYDELRKFYGFDPP